jgi:hypothetical protein
MVLNQAAFPVLPFWRSDYAYRKLVCVILSSLLAGLGFSATAPAPRGIPRYLDCASSAGPPARLGDRHAKVLHTASRVHSHTERVSIVFPLVSLVGCSSAARA